MDLEFELEMIIRDAGDSHDRVSDKQRSYIDFATDAERNEHIEVSVIFTLQVLRALKYSLEPSEESSDRPLTKKINELVKTLTEKVKAGRK